MGKYIKEFNDHTEYEEFVGQVDFDLQTPNISLCNRQNEVHYSPYEKHDYSQDYLTFEIVNNGTLTFINSFGSSAIIYISYSLDNGTTWNQISFSNTPFLNVIKGQKILFKGTNSTYYNSSASQKFGGKFNGTAIFNVSGNIMSMIEGDNFENKNSFTATTNFLGLFSGSNVKNAYNLIFPNTVSQGCYRSMFMNCELLLKAPKELPAITLAGDCYYTMFDGCVNLQSAPKILATVLASYCCTGMFRNCSFLTVAPTLMATNLVTRCYRYMFENCTSLNYIKALFITISDSEATDDWVSGVAANGTFVKNSATTWATTGIDGIPTGWTVQTADS